MRVALGRDATGRRIYHNKTIHGVKKDAEAYLVDMLRRRDMGTMDSAPRVFVGELLDDLISDYRINDKCAWWAESLVENHLRPSFGPLQAAAVRTEAVRKYIEKRRADGARNATINHEIALLRRSFNLARISTPPKITTAPHFPRLEENNARKGFLEHAEFIALRDALPREIRAIVSFAYYTGCRRGEILNLKWRQVDLRENIVRLDPGETKNDEARVIPLVTELAAELTIEQGIRAERYPQSPWVFSRNGEQIKCFRDAWSAAAKWAGLVDADGKATKLFHDLRRTGVRNLVRAGVPEKIAMTISGHKTRSVFDRYNIVNEEDLRMAATRLGGYLRQREREDADEAARAKKMHTGGTQTPSARVN